MMTISERAVARRMMSHLKSLLALGILVTVLGSAPPVLLAGESLPVISCSIGMADAVDLALQHSRQIKLSAADERAMISMRGEARSGFFPSVSVNGYLVEQSMTPNVYSSAGDTMARNYQVPGVSRFQDLNVTAMWPIFSGGRTYYGDKAAGARADAAKQMLRGTEVEVAMQARLDYIAALREQENARVTGELLKQTEERLRVSREEFAAGRVARVNVLRDEAELSNVVQMNTMARNQAELALISFKTTLGVDLASTVVLSEPLQFVATSVSVAEGIQLALASHPEVLAAARQSEAFDSDVRVSRGRYLPDVSATWMYDWASMHNEGEPTEHPEGYSAGLVITFPLFDGFMRENTIDTARAKQDQAREREMLVRQQVVKEVNQAALMISAAEKNVEASRKGQEQAEEQSRIMQERYASGRGIQVEVLDALTTLARARFNVVAALADHQTARAMWLKATGRVR